MSKPRTQNQRTIPVMPVTAKKELDVAKIGAVAASIIALIVSFWAASETRQTRLDTKRMQLRGEVSAFLQETHLAINSFNCYAMVKGADVKGKGDFMQLFSAKEASIRDGLADIADASPNELIVFEKTLNAVRGQLQNIMYENMTIARNSWDKELRDKVDSVCKVW